MNDSWDSSAQWYHHLVGKEGHYYHQVILPPLLSMLSLDSYPSPKLLDLGCGNGVLAQALPPHVEYIGIDSSASLLAKAPHKKKRFLHADCSQPLPVTGCTHAVFLLSLQNIERYDLALEHASAALVDRGMLVLVLNHPCFRIPRQSHWGIDQSHKIQYRRMDLYASPLRIPITVQQGKQQMTTYSFHWSLETLGHALERAHLMIQNIKEIISDKQSTGASAKMEDRARREFPLFLLLQTRKIIL